MDKLEPFGNGNAKPLFAQKNVSFISGRMMGSKGNAAKYQVIDENGGKYELVYFGDIAGFNSFLNAKFGDHASAKLYLGMTKLPVMVAYYPDINEFRGETKVQLIMKYYA